MTTSQPASLPVGLTYNRVSRALRSSTDVTAARKLAMAQLLELDKQEAISVLIEPFLAIPQLEELVLDMYADSGYDDSNYFTVFALCAPVVVFNATPQCKFTFWDFEFDLPGLPVNQPFEFAELHQELKSDITPSWVELLLRAVAPTVDFPAIRVTLKRTKLAPLIRAVSIDLKRVAETVEIVHKEGKSKDD